MSSRPDAGVGVDHQPDGVPPARAADVERVQLEPGAGDDRLQHAAQLVRRPGRPGSPRPGRTAPRGLGGPGRGGAGRGHRRHLLVFRAAAPCWAVAGRLGRSVTARTGPSGPPGYRAGRDDRPGRMSRRERRDGGAAPAGVRAVAQPPAPRATGPTLDRRRVLRLALLALPAAAAVLRGLQRCTAAAEGPGPADRARRRRPRGRGAGRRRDRGEPDLTARIEPLRAARTEHAAALDAEVVRAGGTPSTAPRPTAPADGHRPAVGRRGSPGRGSPRR